VWCSALQCAAGCAAGCRSVLSVLHCVAVCCSVMHSAAVCCKCATVCYIVL